MLQTTSPLMTCMTDALMSTSESALLDLAEGSLHSHKGKSVSARMHMLNAAGCWFQQPLQQACLLKRKRQK